MDNKEEKPLEKEIISEEYTLGKEYYNKFFTKEKCLKNLDEIMGL